MLLSDGTSRQSSAIAEGGVGRYHVAMKERFAQPVLGTFAGYLAGLAANLVVSILVARILGPEGAGVIVLVLTGPNILALVGNLGLARSISRQSRAKSAGFS